MAVDPFTATAAVMSMVSGISSAFGGAAAEKEAERAAKKEARFEGILTLAKLEDLRKEERVLKGQTIAAAAGSGVKTTKGSPLEILAEQAREFSRERMTVMQTGATRSSAALQRGSMVGKQAAYQGYSQGLSGLANAFSLFGQARS